MWAGPTILQRICILLHRTNSNCILMVKLISGNIVHLDQEANLTLPTFLPNNGDIVPHRKFDKVSGDQIPCLLS